MQLSLIRRFRRTRADGTVRVDETEEFHFLVVPSFLGAAKGEALKIVPPEPDNTTNVEDCIKRAKANETEFVKININNVREVKADVLTELLNSLKENTHVEILEMSNVGMTDPVGRVSRIDIVVCISSFPSRRFSLN